MGLIGNQAKRKRDSSGSPDIRKAAGLTGDQAESKRASSGSLDLLLTFFLLRVARD